MKVKMKHDRSTKGTEVYKGEEGSVIPTLYIQKPAFNGKDAPAEITIDIKEL